MITTKPGHQQVYRERAPLTTKQLFISALKPKQKAFHEAQEQSEVYSPCVLF
jgi:hypothetical protein